MMKEKEIIDKFFVSFHDSKLPSDIKKGVGDDAAILSVGNEMLAVSVYTVILHLLTTVGEIIFGCLCF